MEKFTQLFTFIAIAIPFFTSCNFSSKNAIYGNYRIVNKEINITDYDEIKVELAANIVYQQFSDSAPYLQVNTDDNLFSSLDIRVEDNQLIIDTKPDSAIRPTQLTIYTNSKNLKKAHISGSGDFYLRGEVNAKNFDLKISGSGNVRTDSLLCRNLKVNISGSGNVQLTGAAKEATYTVSGSGNIKAFEFFTQFLKCKISGSGNIEAQPREKLDASISGSGSIRYKGLPASINSSVSGSGKIKQVDE
ncbi:MAG: DUF2807 domain-containing protein [Dysgonamonadaceae bacterium]|jgi:hypothetical protein|nr:DUF2807 domain-containing protein [Dysgonamonadaceae bacterium]